MKDGMSRRDFVGAVGAGLLAASAPAQESLKSQPKTGMRVGLDMDKQPSEVRRRDRSRCSIT